MIKISIIIIVVVVLMALLKSKRSNEEEYPYKKRETILTKAEKVFYKELEKIVQGTSVVVFCKVRILDVVEPTKKGYVYLNKISSKHIDFLLCKKSDMSPALAIELDDSTHERRKDRDNFKNKVMEESGLPLERFKVKVSYEKGSIEDRIRPYLKDIKNKA